MKRPPRRDLRAQLAHVQVPRERRRLHRHAQPPRGYPTLPLHPSRDSRLHETPQRRLREIRRPRKPLAPRDVSPRGGVDAERAEEARPAVPERQRLREEQTIAVKPPAAARAGEPLNSTSPRDATGSLAAGSASRSTSAGFSPRGASAR